MSDQENEQHTPCNCMFRTMAGFAPHPGVIVMCPLHRSAPELLEALKAVEPYLLAGDTELHDLVGRAIAKAERKR